MFAAAGEVANIGALLPFLQLLGNPREGLKSLGLISDLVTHLPEENLLLIFAISFGIVVILSTTVRALTIFFQLRLAALIGADLGEKVFSAVLSKPYSWHLNQNSSSILGNLTKDVDQVNNTIQSLLVVIVNFAIVILLGASLLVMAPNIMLIISVLFSIFYFLVFRFIRNGLRSDGNKLTSNYQSSLKVVQEGVGGIRDLLIDNTQHVFLEQYRKRNRIARLAMASINIKAQLPRYLIEGFTLIVVVGLSLSLALSGRSLEQQLPLIGALSLGAYRLLQPIQQCFSSLSNIQANQISLSRLEPFLKAKKLSNSKEDIEVKNFDFASIDSEALLQLRNLDFRYSAKGPWVLKNINITIFTGERIAFVGTTGSGKSTTSDLILGLLEPSAGQLLVHGLDLHSTPGLLNTWQSRLAHVPQSIFLSDDTFKANIAFGVSPSSIVHKRVILAAQKARISDMIENSEHGYESMIGERGIRLSGGQRQRIGLARAFYKHADLLVLDEATSALDNRTESKVMTAIESIDRSTTVLLIAHRLSTIKNCDRIILFDKGQIVGIGCYQELEMHNSFFQSLISQKND